MQKETKVSAVISATTKDLLERQVRATGMKKGRLIENALRHHLLALQELPADIVVNPKIVVTRRSGEKILARIKAPKPTKALKPSRGLRLDAQSRSGDGAPEKGVP